MLYTKELAEQLKTAISEIEVKAEEDKDWMFDVVATTEDTDRDNEVIKVNWWDTKNWEKNPVILANHLYTIENIIWKGLKFYTSNWQKRLKWVFSKTNPLWVLAKNLYQEWMLKTVSVWFLSLKRNEQDYKIIEKAELLEVSFVAVPCNPNAVSLDWKIFDEAVEKWLIIKEVEEEQEIEAKTELQEVKEELAEIKSILKTLADNKVEDEKQKQIIDEETADVKAKKEILQSINKATALALENIKKL